MQQQTEIFVPKHIAMELRKNGFDEPCLAMYLGYNDDNDTIPYIKAEHRLFNAMIENGIGSCTAPTYDQVVGWFASKGIEILIASKWHGWQYEIIHDDEELPAKIVNYPSRQQSLLTAFEEALKLI